jgi:hypothetical protein
VSGRDDYLAWLDTPAGRFRQAACVIEHGIDYEKRQAMVDEVRDRVRRHLGRELYDEEVSAATKQAELRSVTTTTARPMPNDDYELARRFGFGIEIPARSLRDPDGMVPGSARYEGGKWVGPAAEQIAAANAEREAQVAAQLGPEHAYKGALIRPIG